MKKLLTLMVLLLFVAATKAQVFPKVKSTLSTFKASQPFLFSVNTLTESTPELSVNYGGSYGQNTSGPFGYDGLDQQIAIKGYLGNRFTLYANAGLGFARNGAVTSTQQAEVLHDFIGGTRPFGARFGLGIGVNRDISNTGAIFSRVTASFDAASWRINGNFRFEKAFSTIRDGIDLVTSAGFQHRIAGSFFVGLEAVGEDLEGFWEADEAEGGAKLLVGPSVNITPERSKFSFSICGGPVFYATHSVVIPSDAIRDVGTIATQNGYTVKAMISFNLR